jgi:ribosomal RNA-processing protein 8
LKQIISSRPKNHVIADLGCGDGRLAKSVPHKVYSFDLVALDPTINVCDMANTPLQPEQIDCVVFCLSLMGTNSKDYIVEANRILKNGYACSNHSCNDLVTLLLFFRGLLKIAEVESRFENVDKFTSDLKKYGFSLVKKDYNQQLFYFMDFKKDNDVKKKNKLPEINLNPCIYKKR